MKMLQIFRLRVKAHDSVPGSGEDAQLYIARVLRITQGRIMIREGERSVTPHPVAAIRPIPNFHLPYTDPSAFVWGP